MPNELQRHIEVAISDSGVLIAYSDKHMDGVSTVSVAANGEVCATIERDGTEFFCGSISPTMRERLLSLEPGPIVWARLAGRGNNYIAAKEVNLQFI